MRYELTVEHSEVKSSNEVTFLSYRTACWDQVVIMWRATGSLVPLPWRIEHQDQDGHDNVKWHN